MTLTHITNLLPPLTNAISLQSWEDVEDLASEIRRLARFKRLSELQSIQESLALKNEAKAAPRGSQVANSPPVGLNSELAFRPEPGITSETRFDEVGHEELWRNNLAIDLNSLLGIGRWLNIHHDDWQIGRQIESIAARVAQFEEIQTKT